MSVRVGFYLGSRDGLLQHFLAGPLSEFLDWYRENQVEFPEDVDPLLPEFLEKVIVKGESHLLFPEPANLTDRLLTDYYGIFYQGRLRSAEDSALRLDYYIEDENQMEKDGHTRLVDLMHIIQAGRSVAKNNNAFNSGDDIFRLGFWNFDEVIELCYLTEGLSNKGGDELNGLYWIRVAALNALNEQTGLITIVS